jgi:hypothetical protein
VGYQLVNNGQVQYAVDWSVVDRLLRGYWSAEMRNSYSRVVKSSEASWYNPASWALPEIAQLEVDWDLVRAQARSGSAIDAAQLRQRGDRDMRSVAKELEWKVGRGATLTTSFLDTMGALQSDNMARINRAVSSYATQIEVAKFLRDTSADGLMVGATLLSGGAAAAVLTGGSTMKGWARYQDTDNVGAAVLTGVGNLVFVAVPMEKWTLVIVQSAWESGTSLAEGKSFVESLANGTLKLAGPGSAKLVGSLGVTKMLQRAGIPIRITVAGADAAAKFVDKLGGKMVQKQVVEKRIGKPLIAAALGGSSASSPSAGEAPSASLVRTSTFSDDLLLKFAIVNMEKGIGWGW